jgi:hypothetical protein
MQGGANDWLDLIGARVLPSFLSVVDDPTLTSVQGVNLHDSYRVDDEGVAARPTKVIERGILKTLLMTRVPVSGIEHSTGSRRGNGAAPSHLIVSADSGLPADELRRKLFSLASRRTGLRDRRAPVDESAYDVADGSIGHDDACSCRAVARPPTRRSARSSP